MSSSKEDFLKFESIGNNCEFGIFQRHIGFDPPGLFRNVGYINPRQIISCISSGLEKMFEAGSYKYVLPEGWTDWRLDCQIYGLGFHSRIPKEIQEGSEEWSKLTKSNIAQFRFLKNKFIDDLDEGEKIFVYRSKGFLDENAAFNLLNAIRKHGSSELLYVYENPFDSEPKTQMNPGGLITASIHRLSNENPPQIDFDSWLKICDDALELTKRSTPAKIEKKKYYLLSGKSEEASEEIMLNSALEIASEEERRKNWPTLIKITQEIRAHFPKETRAYQLEAKAKMEIGKLLEASNLLYVALHLSPEDPSLIEFHARLANRCGDNDLSLKRWQDLARVQPDNPAIISELAEAYQAINQHDMADAQLENAMERAPDYAPIAIKWASLALRRGDHEEALRRWQIVRSRFPDESEGYAAAGHNLRSIGQYEEADAIVEQGLKRLPGNRDLLTSFAWTATVKCDWPEAERRWRQVKSRWPTDGAMINALANAIEHQGRREEAEQILQEGIEALPESQSIHLALAERLLKREDWQRAYDLFYSIIERFPGQVRPYAAIGHILRAQYRYSEAEKYTEMGLKHFPNSYDLLVSHAWTARAQGDWLKSAERWEIVRGRFPNSTEAILGLAESFEKQGRIDDADILLTQASIDFPDDSNLSEALATLATKTNRG